MTEQGNWWRINRQGDRACKATVLFNDLHRGGKATFNFNQAVQGRPEVKHGIVHFQMAENTYVTRGEKQQEINVRIDRSVGNTGDGKISGFSLYGFVMLSVDYNGKTHNKWHMVVKNSGANVVELQPCNMVQSAVLSRKTMANPHVMTHVGPANGWADHALVPREKSLIACLHMDPRGPKKAMTTLISKSVETHGLRFSKFGDAGKGGARSGKISLLFVPGFSVAVIDVQSLTSFRIDNDDNRVFNLERGRWKIENMEPSMDIEIFSESSGSVHRAKVSVGSAEKVLTKTGKRHKNNSVFRRI